MKAALLLYAALLCHGAFEYRNGNPDSLFPLQSAVHDWSSPVVMTTPALLPFADGLLLNSSAGRPYSEEILATAGSTIQYGSGDYGLQISWNSFGADFYREHTFSLKGGYSIFPFLHGGISGNIYMLKIADSELQQEREAADTDIAFLFTPFSWINFAVIQAGVASLFNEQNSDLIYPERSAGIIVKPGRGFSLAWNITETAAERANMFTAAINPAPFFSLKGGYCRESSSLAASMGILAGNFFVSYGLRYHPYLGYTHSLGMTYTLNTAIEGLDYGKRIFSPPVKKLNIRSASPDELKNINGLSGLSAERIILYREKIGPLNEKALMQIGLSSEEIKILEANIYGLERTPRNKEGKKDFRKFKKIPPRRERIKDKFRGLISLGIPAYTAITYSELSESGKPDDVHNRLSEDHSLNDEQKRVIEKTCSE